MYRVLFTKEAAKSLKQMPRNTARRVQEKLAILAQDPYASQNNVTKLQNRPGYRLRVGDWHMIYELEGEQIVILVLKIAPRGEVYR
ncbi:MAG: type II toxin-antitoxin system RelE/ParE family toxin [Caldilineaceae bacterium]|nr:type II toxin-antitoxin system RelE/ParE family toxin [Caldilineaceae bacterium]